MVIEVLTLVVAGLGAAGGCAGFYALKMQREDREERRRIAKVPPELRPLLVAVIDASRQVVERPRDRAWCGQHVDPLWKRIRNIEPVLDASGFHSLGRIALLGAQVASIEAHARSDLERPSDEVALNAVKQRDFAKGAMETASAILAQITA